MFIPLMKAVAAQRLVSGYLDETPDRAGEIMDYATAKGAFQDWSAGMEKASGGKSLGNIRGQHANIAAGKLVDITFDDMAKAIHVTAKIVDDNEWRKVEEGVYTGFSPGGKYAKRWADAPHHRYTPLVKELSIVDIPCKPESTFTMVKADGAEEEVEFVLAKAYEPGNEATRDRADTLAKAAGKPDRRNDFVVQARADLIAENATEALAKMAEAEAAPVVETPDPVAVVDAALAKAAKVASATDADSGPFSDLAKAAAALKLLTAPDGLEKSLWSVTWLSRLLSEFADLQASVTWDEKCAADGGDMALPTKAAEIVKAIGELLISMAQDGVADLLACIENNGIEIDTVVVVDDAVDSMALAHRIVDLVKADTALMEKAGARNSKGDAAKIQSMHDNSVELGASCPAVAEKDALATLAADRDRLAKALTESAPRIEQLAEAMETMQANGRETSDRLTKALGEIETLKAQPMPVKGVVMAMEKTIGGTEPEADATDPFAHLSPGDRLVAQARQERLKN